MTFRATLGFVGPLLLKEECVAWANAARLNFPLNLSGEFDLSSNLDTFFRQPVRPQFDCASLF